LKIKNQTKKILKSKVLESNLFNFTSSEQVDSFLNFILDEDNLLDHLNSSTTKTEREAFQEILSIQSTAIKEIVKDYNSQLHALNTSFYGDLVLLSKRFGEIYNAYKKIYYTHRLLKSSDSAHYFLNLIDVNSYLSKGKDGCHVTLNRELTLPLDLDRSLLFLPSLKERSGTKLVHVLNDSELINSFTIFLNSKGLHNIESIVLRDSTGRVTKSLNSEDFSKLLLENPFNLELHFSPVNCKYFTINMADQVEDAASIVVLNRFFYMPFGSIRYKAFSLKDSMLKSFGVSSDLEGRENVRFFAKVNYFDDFNQAKQVSTELPLTMPVSYSQTFVGNLIDSKVVNLNLPYSSGSVSATLIDGSSIPFTLIDDKLIFKNLSIDRILVGYDLKLNSKLPSLNGFLSSGGQIVLFDYQSFYKDITGELMVELSSSTYSELETPIVKNLYFNYSYKGVELDES